MNPAPLSDDPERARVSATQQLLFPPNPRDICVEIGLNWWTAVKLHQDGWLSFNPESSPELDEATEAELRFVGSIVAAGCDAGLLRQLLGGLSKPYRYDGSRIYYDWSARCWRFLPGPETVFSDWLESLVTDEDVGRLKELKDQIDEALKSAGEANSDAESESENYVLTAHDHELLTAAKLLLNKVASSAGLHPAQLATVEKLQRALADMPVPNTEMDVLVSVSSPRRSFGEAETFHWWSVALENGCLRLESGGHFYQPSTGGDSFTSMMWSVQPGEESEFSDFKNNLRIVPDVRTYPDGIASVDFASGGYSVEVTDSDNPLLDEMEEEDDEDEAEDDEEQADNEDHDEPEIERVEFTVSPVDASETAIARQIDEATVHSNEPAYSCGGETCGVCECELSTRGFFVDGMMGDGFEWANMCVPCFNLRGAGIGWGRGQLYARQPNGDWRLVAGFQPPNKDHA